MKNWTEILTQAGKGVGVLAAGVGLIGAGLLVVYWVLPYLSISSTGIHIIDDPGNLGAENASISAFWAAVIAIVSLFTGYVVWMEYMTVLWALAVLLPILTYLGMFSIGQFIAPFALLVVLSALLLTVGRWARKPTHSVHRS